MDIVDIDLISKLSYEYAVNHMVLPIKLQNNKVLVKACECNKEIIEYLETVYGRKIDVLECSSDEIKNSICNQYKSFVYNSSDKSNKLAEEIIKLAIRERASDIHFESFDDECIVRFRVDGIMYSKFRMSRLQYDSLCIQIKFLANMDISDKMMPQDGKVKFKYHDSNMIDLRVSSIPTVSGEKLVIRILFKNEELMELYNMCYTEKQKKLMNNFLAVKEGLIIICGPTGSGKSTTLYAMLKKEKSDQLNITTIEDPAEFLMNNINQININEKIGLTFSKVLKHVLRQDPDVIMLGEIRDEDTAENTVRAAITGHKVYTTLHTDSIFNVYSRLKDMGVKEYLLKDCLKGVVSQRLVRKLCPHCRKEVYDYEDKYGIKKAYRAQGCTKCNKGYLGRIVIYEMLYVNFENKNGLKNGVVEDEESFVDLHECLNDYVEKGYISYDDYVEYMRLYDERVNIK